MLTPGFSKFFSLRCLCNKWRCSDRRVSHAAWVLFHMVYDRIYGGISASGGGGSCMCSTASWSRSGVRNLAMRGPPEVGSERPLVHHGMATSRNLGQPQRH
jgi:hypothetical protein